MDQVPIALQFYTSGGKLQVVGKTAGVVHRFSGSIMGY